MTQACHPKSMLTLNDNKLPFPLCEVLISCYVLKRILGKQNQEKSIKFKHGNRMKLVILSEVNDIGH